uniref:Uncharacterized protein n=1 Tax=Utricularia reniformis TaxID=192314 RepID=A0A1Y0B003_9LAMI|nr:hypothetical protein AEK19_MT0444 [Utricularia reniformis]ART30708.1 hypothetical protein AEK19_MT0444 [Utricularia reniformis]
MTASERTFVRFFFTKHGSVRNTVGRWLPKETPIRSASRLGKTIAPHPDHKERFTMMGVLFFIPSGKNEMHRGPRHAPQIYGFAGSMKWSSAYNVLAKETL